MVHRHRQVCLGLTTQFVVLMECSVVLLLWHKSNKGLKRVMKTVFLYFQILILSVILSVNDVS